MKKPHIVIISPALAKANNGNWRTAHRWDRFLRDHYQVSLSSRQIPDSPDALIALHARRSADAIAEFSTTYPERPLIVVLTGTDLYRDIHINESAQRSLKVATHLIVLQLEGKSELPVNLHEKTGVIYQSATILKPVNHPAKKRHFTVTMIGHLRHEKDPLTFLQAVERVPSSKIRFFHIGRAIDFDLEQAASELQNRHARYRWLGNRSHGDTRRLLKQSQLMVLTSKMEGGANVIAEALTSGVPVLASDISGNRGMLGNTYAGYFPTGDSTRLAALIDRAATNTEFYRLLCHQCNARADLFSPEREKAALLHLLDNALNIKRITS